MSSYGYSDSISFEESSTPVSEADAKDPEYDAPLHACLAVYLQKDTLFLLVLHVVLFCQIELSDCNRLSDLANQLSLGIFCVAGFRFLFTLVMRFNDERRRYRQGKRIPSLNWWVESCDIAETAIGIVLLGLLSWLFYEQGDTGTQFLVTEIVLFVILFVTVPFSVCVQMSYILSAEEENEKEEHSYSY